MGSYYGCDDILSGIIFASIVSFLWQLVILVITDITIESELFIAIILSGKTLNDFLNGFNEKEKLCLEQLFKDIDGEKTFYDKAIIVIKVLLAISLISLFALCIYTFSMCCYNTKFYSLSFIVPLYGILCNIIILCLLNKSRIENKCNLEEEFNEKINKQLIILYSDIDVSSTVIACFSLFFYFFCLILILCLKCRTDNRAISNASSTIVAVNPKNKKINHKQIKPYKININSKNKISKPGSVS